MKIIYYEGDKIHSASRQFLPDASKEGDSINWSFEVMKDEYRGYCIKIYATKTTNNGDEFDTKVEMVDFSIGKKFVQALLPLLKENETKN